MMRPGGHSRPSLLFGWSLLAALFPLLSAQAVPAPAPLNASTRVRVRLTEGTPKVEIRGFDLRIHSQAGSEAEIPSRKPAAVTDRTTEWEFRCSGSRIRALPKGGGKPLVLTAPVMIDTPAGFLKYRNRPYRESLTIHSKGTLCEVVNTVDLEKYLDGLVNAEFSSRWSEEAVSAQVIAARTYAYYQLRAARKNPKSHHDLDATVRDQVYDGSIKEDFRASRAVERTRGMVLVAGPGPIKAFYHSTCGGLTEIPEKVWGGSFAGFRNPVLCPFCARSPRMSWKLDLQSREIAAALLRGSRGEGGEKGSVTRNWPKDWLAYVREGRLIEIRVPGSRGELPSTRVDQVVTVWSKGSNAVEISVPGPKFRDWLGTSRFKSTWFKATAHRGADGNRWHFEGRGAGHGVGMCQYGAKGMAEQGYKASLILSHYYPGAVLKKLW